MRSAISQTLQMLNRRSRSGQSIVIIALGFIGLVAFVGIATDTAVLFVRYSSLHRAVDAAAIAAAGAARQSSNFASLGTVAEEYIKIHGLQPTSVKVEDCATEIVDYRNSSPSHSGMTDAQIFGVLAANPQEQLCTIKPEKLVRVDAQIDSQTTFLSLIGFPTVKLSASSVSQTASLDVALLIDASYSESYDTRFSQNVDTSVGVTPANLKAFSPVLGYFNNLLAPYDDNNKSGAPTGAYLHGSIRAECRNIVDYYSDWKGTNPQPLTTSYDSVDNGYANYYYGGCCNEPVTFTAPGSGADLENWYIYSDPNKYPLPLLNTFNVANLFSGQSPMDTSNPQTGGGFANRNYSNLVCKPFKYVRDAARDFLNHFDFNGGDRAMLITFDDTVHELTSNGEYNNPSDAGNINGAVPIFNSKTDAIIALNKYAGVQISPMGFTSRCLAEYYPPYNFNGQYYNGTNTINPQGTALVYETAATCPDTNTGGAVLAGQSLLTDPNWIRRDSVWVMVILSDGFPNRTPGLSAVCVPNQICNPSIGNGGAGQSQAIHKINEPSTDPYYTLHYGDPAYYAVTAHNNLFFGQAGFSYPPSNTPWDLGRQPISALTTQAMTDPGFCPWNTFCDPTGGGQLLANPSKLYPSTNPDPNAAYLYPNGDLYPNPEQHLLPNPNNGQPDATGNTPDLTSYNAAYCQASDSEPNPIWWIPADVSSDSALQYNSNHVTLPNKVLCTNTNPDKRHFCMNPTTGVIDPAIQTGSVPNQSDPNLCSINYDPTDYARDQVDFAALTDYTKTLKGNSVAMYSIFFPHQNATVSNPNPDIGSYILGAKFMRYVADAGDNGVIDNHLQAWYRLPLTNPSQYTYQTDPQPLNGGDYNPNDYPAPPNGTIDPCTAYDYDMLQQIPGSHTAPTGIYYQGEGYEDLYKYNCGNYYYAGSSAAVDQAFLSIASRLYTRLAH